MNALVLALLLLAPQEAAPHAPASPEAAASPSAHPSAAEEVHQALQAGAEDALGAPAHAPAAGHEEDHGPAALLMHHVTDERWGHLQVGPFDLGLTKHLTFILVAAAVLLVVLWLAKRSYGKDRVPRGWASFVETILVFIRDEIAEKNIGHDGRAFVPLLASFFFFILFAALIGLIPRAATATGNFNVTLGLAFVSFVATQLAGIRKYGVVHHFAGMIPSGLPWFLVPIMIPVELLAMFARPFALTVRLFANMIAGHMVITTLLLLIPMMAKVSTFMGVAMIPVSLGLGLFIMFLELLVAFLQAFIFTLLSSIFIGMAAHPAH
jgi:F-type H+-transporting ATPase subunit a